MKRVSSSVYEKMDDQKQHSSVDRGSEVLKEVSHPVVEKDVKLQPKR